jgi:hypothetical protein
VIPREPPFARTAVFTAKLHHGLRLQVPGANGSQTTLGPAEDFDGHALEEERAEREQRPAPYRHENVLVEPFRKYKSTMETHRSRHRHHKSAMAQLRHDVLRQLAHAPVPDWREVLRFMDSATPVPRKDEQEKKAVKLAIAEADAFQLFRNSADEEEALWDIRYDIGCNVERVAGAVESGTDKVQLRLSGSLGAVEEAMRYLQNRAREGMTFSLHKYDNPELDAAGGSASGGERDSRAVPFPMNHVRRYELRLPVSHLRRVYKRGRWVHEVEWPAHEIPKPYRWTKASFLDYISLLANSRISRRAAANEHYKSHDHHREAVIAQMHRVFRDPQTQACLSTPAFKVALRFLASIGCTKRPHTRAFFLRMVMTDMRIDAEVYELVLYSLAREGDLRNFQTMLRRMVSRDIAPKLGTWTSFLVLIKHADVRKAIMQVMREKGLLTVPSAVQAVDKAMIEDDFERHIRACGDLRSFLANRDALYGTTMWRSTFGGKLMAGVLCQHRLFDECKDLLGIMANEWEMQPSVDTLSTILRHCSLRNADFFPDAAMDFIRLFDQHSAMFQNSMALQPGVTTLRLMFELAYANKLPHLLGTVWQYALITHQTSWRMRARVTKLMYNGERRRKFLSRLLGQMLERPTASQVPSVDSTGKADVPRSDSVASISGIGQADQDIDQDGTSDDKDEDRSNEALMDRVLFGTFMQLARHARNVKDSSLFDTAPTTEGESERSAESLSASAVERRDRDGQLVWEILESADVVPAMTFANSMAEAYERDKSLMKLIAEGNQVEFRPRYFSVVQRRRGKTGEEDSFKNGLRPA